MTVLWNIDEPMETWTVDFIIIYHSSLLFISLLLFFTFMTWTLHVCASSFRWCSRRPRFDKWIMILVYQWYRTGMVLHKWPYFAIGCMKCMYMQSISNDKTTVNFRSWKYQFKSIILLLQLWNEGLKTYIFPGWYLCGNGRYYLQ